MNGARSRGHLFRACLAARGGSRSMAPPDVRQIVHCGGGDGQTEERHRARSRAGLHGRRSRHLALPPSGTWRIWRLLFVVSAIPRRKPRGSRGPAASLECEAMFANARAQLWRQATRQGPAESCRIRHKQPASRQYGTCGRLDEQRTFHPSFGLSHGPLVLAPGPLALPSKRRTIPGHRRCLSRISRTNQSA